MELIKCIKAKESVSNLMFSKRNSNEIVLTHGGKQEQIIVWDHSSMEVKCVMSDKR